MLNLEEKFKDVKDYRWLKRYLNFIEKFQRDSIYKNTHKHHILPKSLYPEFENFSENEWNGIYLDYRSHLIAHYMMAKALEGNMWFAYNNMNAYGEKLNSILYESALKNFTIENSKKKIGTVCVKDGEDYIIVSQEEFNQNDKLVGVTKGLFIGEKNVSKRKDVRKKISDANSNRIHCEEIATGLRKFIKETEFNDTIYKKIIPVDNSGYTSIRTESGIERITTEEFQKGNYTHFNKGLKRTQEFKDNLSKRMKGIKKKNTDKRKKKKTLTKNNKMFEFLGNKDLEKFCKEKEISVTILRKYIGKTVTEISKTNRPKLIEISKNTLGWKLEEI